VLVDILLVVGNDGLGDSLTDGVDLGGVTTTGDADADVDTGELVETDDEERLIDLVLKHVRGRPLEIETAGATVFRGARWRKKLSYLESEDLRLDQGKRPAVDLDEALALLLSDSVIVLPPRSSFITYSQHPITTHRQSGTVSYLAVGDGGSCSRISSQS